MTIVSVINYDPLIRTLFGLSPLFGEICEIGPHYVDKFVTSFELSFPRLFILCLVD